MNKCTILFSLKLTLFFSLNAQTDQQLRNPEYLVDQYNQLVAKHNALIEKTNPSFAPSMVEYYLKNLMEDVKKQNSGEPLDDEKVRDHYMPVAERNVKWYALRNKLIDHGKLEVSKDDLNTEIERLVEANTSSGNEIRKFYKKPSNLKRLEDGLMEKIILKYLEQFAKVKEVEVQTKDLRGKENEY